VSSSKRATFAVTVEVVMMEAQTTQEGPPNKEGTNNTTVKDDVNSFEETTADGLPTQVVLINRCVFTA
jgi:hypothetical protein